MIGRLREAGEMDDQGIEARPALGSEDSGDRPVVGGIRAEAVDRLGRKGDQPAGPKEIRGLAYDRLIRGNDGSLNLGNRRFRHGGAVQPGSSSRKGA